jgi:hypothetical protein
MDEPKVERIFPTIVHYHLGLIKLIRLAVGYENSDKIDSRITSQRFKIAETGVRKVNLKLKFPLEGETCMDAAWRLEGEGYTLADTGELAAFLENNPKEVEKYFSVLALGRDARWEYIPDVGIYVPCASVSAGGAERYFLIYWFHAKLYSDHAILVSGGSE